MGNRTRVTPDWKKTVSSKRTYTHLLPVSIDERPLLYTEFFDELDKHLQY
jgi:hypothetical protein